MKDAHKQLKLILQRNPKIINNPHQLKSAFNDIWHDNSVCVTLLLSAYNDNIVDCIKHNNVLKEDLLKRLQDSLQKHGIQESYAQWAIVTWFLAYGKTVPSKMQRVDFNTSKQSIRQPQHQVVSTMSKSEKTRTKPKQNNASITTNDTSDCPDDDDWYKYMGKLRKELEPLIIIKENPYEDLYLKQFQKLLIEEFSGNKEESTKIATEVDQKTSTMMQAMDWSYNKAMGGITGSETVDELAQYYLKGNGSLLDKVDELIRWQNAKCATSGFLTGIGGLLTLPVAIPANLASVLYVQLRMIAAIAKMGGYDIHDDRVRTLAYICLCGNSAKDVLKDIGIAAGQKFAINFLKTQISKELIYSINKAVGFRLVTKAGSTGVINLGKAVPIVGGVIGAAFDGITTNVVGEAAKRMFILGNP